MNTSGLGKIPFVAEKAEGRDCSVREINTSIFLVRDVELHTYEDD